MIPGPRKTDMGILAVVLAVLAIILGMGHYDLTFAGPLTFAPNWHLAEHRHVGRHEMIIVVSGAIETRIGGKVLLGKPGSTLLYPQEVPHEERSAARVPLRMMYVAFAGELRADGLPFMRGGGDRRREMLARWLGETAKSDKPLAALLLDTLVASYVGGRETANDAVSRAKAFVQNHLAEPIKLEDLADAAGMSAFHFARIFRAETGSPPMRYVRKLRVEAARMLLATTPLPLKAIAPAVGLRDEFELSRVFKRETGLVPSSTRESTGGPSPHRPK